jgi:hypothetical protein
MIYDIVTEINEVIENCLQLDDSVYYNIARVVNVNNEIYPITAVNGKTVKICLNDNLNLQLYHKVMSIVPKEESFDSSGKSFGKEYKYTFDIGMKMIVIQKSALSQIKPEYSPEYFSNVLPQRLTLQDYKSIKIIKSPVTTDHDAIVAREWKKIDYSKHKCKFLVFEVNYNIRAVTCKLACGSFLLLEDDYKLLQEDSSYILL